jgi:hypothetical protein
MSFLIDSPPTAPDPLWQRIANSNNYFFEKALPGISGGAFSFYKWFDLFPPSNFLTL